MANRLPAGWWTCMRRKRAIHPMIIPRSAASRPPARQAVKAGKCTHLACKQNKNLQLRHLLISQRPPAGQARGALQVSAAHAVAAHHVQHIQRNRQLVAAAPPQRRPVVKALVGHLSHRRGRSRLTACESLSTVHLTADPTGRYTCARNPLARHGHRAALHGDNRGGCTPCSQPAHGAADPLWRGTCRLQRQARWPPGSVQTPAPTSSPAEAGKGMRAYSCEQSSLACT